MKENLKVFCLFGGFGLCFVALLYLDVLTECVMGTGGEEDCSQLFLECPFAQEIWTRQNISGVDITSQVLQELHSNWRGFQYSEGLSGALSGVEYSEGRWSGE